MSSDFSRGTYIGPMQARIRDENQPSDFPDIAFFILHVSESLFESLFNAGYAISGIDYATEFALDLGNQDFSALDAAGQTIEDYVLPCRLLLSQNHLIIQGRVLAAADREWPFITESFDVLWELVTEGSKRYRANSENPHHPLPPHRRTPPIVGSPDISQSEEGL
tara:strand:+ start:15230 stop:15724 length:495 start_codon:yes stop_codon:yes gene_type:complete